MKHIKYENGNCLLFRVLDESGNPVEDSGGEGESHELTFYVTPLAMAFALRAAANWIEAHSQKHLLCEID